MSKIHKTLQYESIINIRCAKRSLTAASVGCWLSAFAAVEGAITEGSPVKNKNRIDVMKMKLACHADLHGHTHTHVRTHTRVRACIHTKI